MTGGSTTPRRARNQEILIRANPARASFPSKMRTAKSAVESNRSLRRRDGIDKRCAPTKSPGLSLIVKDAGRVTAVGGASAVPAGLGSSPWLPGGLGIILPAL